MKVRTLFCSCVVLIALAIMPSRLLADAFCSDPPPYQYQSCGVVAPTNIFTVNQYGLGAGVIMFFRDDHADFASDIQARVFRNGQLVYTGSPSPTNQQMTRYQGFTLVPENELRRNDEIELVLNVVNDPNGAQSFYSRSQDFGLNSDGVNHTWATNLSSGLCAIFRPDACIFAGFEDLPAQEGSDYDYNDFEAWFYGVDFTSMGQFSVPEPPSILLLMGAPLAFAFGKLCRFF